MRSILAQRDDGHAPCTHVTELIPAHLDDIDRRLAELVTTREALRALVGRTATTAPATCGADDICPVSTPHGCRRRLPSRCPLSRRSLASQCCRWPWTSRGRVLTRRVPRSAPPAPDAERGRPGSRILPAVSR
ncbi:MerR family DNA-binding protein [Streptomyces sp. GDS52]|uniref:MerR family DNA-binding protein n=1 Tax=unclassified Streptomyces TaxID=2593676 RepID=UPI003666912F